MANRYVGPDRKPDGLDVWREQEPAAWSGLLQLGGECLFCGLGRHCRITTKRQQIADNCH